jgi:hypothetical protein
MKHSVVVLLSALLYAGNALAADVPATKPDATANKPGATATKASKPSSRGPGTQTEDELYIGAKAKTPNAVKSQKPKAKTGDEDLEDLEVERAAPAKRSR